MHDEKCITTFPYYQKYGNKRDHRARSDGAIYVEDDVWIAYGVKILSGVKIGKGAIIAAGSIVTRDIPAYAVAAGVPARVIRYRFGQEVIRRLEEIHIEEYGLQYILEHPEIFRRPCDDTEMMEVLDRLEKRSF